MPFLLQSEPSESLEDNDEGFWKEDPSPPKKTVKEKELSVQEDLLWEYNSDMSVAISNYQGKPGTARITICMYTQKQFEQRAGGEKQTTAESTWDMPNASLPDDFLITETDKFLLQLWSCS